MLKNKWLYLLIPIPFILLLELIFYIPPFNKINETLILVFLFPVAEEVFKFAISKKTHSMAFLMILSFGVFEILMAKLPIILSNTNYGNITLMVLSTIIAFNFHSSTAFAYSNKKFNNHGIFILVSCIVFHIVFNSIDIFVKDKVASYIVAISLSLSPLLLTYNKLYKFVPQR